MADNNEAIFNKIDEIEDRIFRYKVSPAFEEELEERKNRSPRKIESKDSLLAVYAIIAAFSQGANSRLVRDMLVFPGHFEKLFQSFSVEKVSGFDYEEFMNEHWKKPLTYIGKRGKVRAILDFAKKLKDDESLFALLTQNHIPIRVNKEKDIELFWKEFDYLLKMTQEKEVRFLRTTTSLLHYLLDTGYDCIKPDSAVMEVAEKIGIVKVTSGDKNLRKVVNTLFQYSVRKRAVDGWFRPPVVDLYFLIAKPQEGAKHLVKPDFFQYLGT